MPQNLEDLLENFSSLAGQKKITMPTTQPPIEVTENGQRVSNPRMDPAIMNFIMMASIASQAVKIRKYFDDRTPNGRVQSWGGDVPLVIEDTVHQIGLSYPAQSISIFNDGANAVDVWINVIGRPKHRLNRGEQYDLNFETHIISHIFLQCPTIGGTTEVRVVAKD